MSRRLKDGSWLMPEKQVREFFTKEIDYHSLIMDCIESMKKRQTLKVKSVPAHRSYRRRK